MATKTAICKDAQGAYVPVFCKLWENWHGATDLGRTREQLTKDHPDLKFVAWVSDLSDTDSLNCYFLSPNVIWRNIWIETDLGFQQVRLNRDLTVEPT